AKLADGLREVAGRAGVAVVTNRVGSMLALFFTDRPVLNFSDARKCDTDRFALYYRAMLEEGIYLAPSQYEAAFVSGAHSDQDIRETVEAAARVFEVLAK
ncbi:MAG: aspartate aminotransferase family protein, partial [Deltaproteobacteria bacterium]|nr:aspartate aminotransferase family protein [Deltaproteobacteria bacterium]